MIPTKIWKRQRERQIQERVILVVTIALAIFSLTMSILGIRGVFVPVSAAQLTPDEMIDGMLHEVDCTAYYNKYNSPCADGSWPEEGLTVAGPEEWLGCVCVLYDEDKRLIGFYEFRDTGYGQETGYGESKVLPGRTVGTIEAGECIDLYFENFSDCMEWGRKRVYIQVIPAVG